MPYYVRAFCKSAGIPALNLVFDSINNKGYPFTLRIVENTLEGDLINWKSFEMNYKEGKGPIIVEFNVVDDEDGLAKEEIEEFLDRIGSAGFSLRKRKVIHHLKQTKYLICNQLLSDIDNDGYDANGEFMNYFVQHCEGMQQADGEGFYDSNMNLILDDK
ncbi:MAG: hypothetical protein JST09_09965 [Bacteroidetes bacterium]|nr:hypothetical protein [Bacteroidota bacterium]MBS1609024.1 hypothetical protein [Bacteroidota bacterium]